MIIFGFSGEFKAIPKYDAVGTAKSIYWLWFAGFYSPITINCFWRLFHQEKAQKDT